MYITTVNCDIGKFNQYVKLLVQSLTARNQSTSDLLINLFKGYSAVSDEVFRTWLSRKQDDHREGETIINKFELIIKGCHRVMAVRPVLCTPPRRVAPREMLMISRNL
jgi:hypothetical protein